MVRLDALLQPRAAQLMSNSRVLFTAQRLRKCIVSMSQLRKHLLLSQCQGGFTNSSQGNYSARVIKRNPWFTFCFIPVLPLSFHGYEDVICSICNFAQPLQNRQDVIAQMNGGGMQLQHQPLPGQQQAGPPPGWGGPGGGPPPKQQQNMQYR
jgi:hypothetical protein